MTPQWNAAISLLRHGTAIKNEDRVHGGAGTELSESGRTEIRQVASRIEDFQLRFRRIAYCPLPQCAETAAILANHLEIPATAEQELPPIFLGVADGLSETELRLRYPDVARRVDLWRTGKIEVQELCIPGSEPPEVFYVRGVNWLRAISASGESVLLVATRSILILIASILLGRRPVPGGGYREIPWGTGEILTFTPSDRGFSINNLLSTHHHFSSRR